MKKEDDLKAKKVADPVAEALLLLLKQRIKAADNVGDEIKRIAFAINKKPSTIQSLIYENKGGFSLRVATFIKAFRLKDSQVKNFFEDLEIYLNKISPVRQSDKGWVKLDSLLSEREKCHWVEVIKVLKRLDIKLEKEEP